jgi:hypothetical protein
MDILGRGGALLWAVRFLSPQPLRVARWEVHCTLSSVYSVSMVNDQLVAFVGNTRGYPAYTNLPCS